MEMPSDEQLIGMLVDRARSDGLQLTGEEGAGGRVDLPVWLRAGDATFHQSRTVHEAGGNRTDEIRLGVIVTFTDAEATYRPHPDNDPLPLKAGQPIAGDRYPRAGRS